MASGFPCIQVVEALVTVGYPYATVGKGCCYHPESWLEGNGARHQPPVEEEGPSEG